MFLPAALAVSFLLQAAAVAASPARRQAEQPPYVAPFTSMPERPKLPKVDLNSCPFEGCQFGQWTATATVVVYSTWKSKRKPIATLSKGDEVTALTGVTVVLQAGKGVFDRDVPLYGARKGDVAYLYSDCGEGTVDMWVHGRFIKCADPMFSWQPGYGCQTSCNGRWLSLGKSEWWAQILRKGGTTGWVLVHGNFDGTDALASSEPHTQNQIKGKNSPAEVRAIPVTWSTMGKACEAAPTQHTRSKAVLATPLLP
jgi:hypothetical protein